MTDDHKRPSACLACRRRKVKCSHDSPRCERCEKYNIQCIYKTSERRRMLQPRQGYHNILEQKLAEVSRCLENERLRVNVLEKTLDSFRNNVGSVSSLDSSRSSSDKSVLSPPSPIEMAAQQDLSRNLVLLNNEGSCEPLLSSNKQHVTPSNPSIQRIFENDPLNIDDSSIYDSIPSTECMNRFHDFYFKVLHSLFPVINKGKFLSVASELSSKSTDYSPLFDIVWSLSVLFDQRYSKLANLYYRRARAKLQAQLMFGECGLVCDTIEHLQTMLLMARFEHFNGNVTRSWYTIGRACRSAQLLNLHCIDEESHMCTSAHLLHKAHDCHERHERRLIFWCAYLMDRYACLNSGWPSIFEDDSIKTYLPIQIHDGNLGPLIPVEPGLFLSDVLRGEGEESLFLDNFSAHVFLVSVALRSRQSCHISLTESRLSQMSDAAASNAWNMFWNSYQESDRLLSRIARVMNKAQVDTIVRTTYDMAVILLNQTALEALLNADPDSYDFSDAEMLVERCVEASLDTCNYSYTKLTNGTCCSGFVIFRVHLALQCMIRILALSLGSHRDSEMRQRIEAMLSIFSRFQDIKIINLYLQQYNSDRLEAAKMNKNSSLYACELQGRCREMVFGPRFNLVRVHPRLAEQDRKTINDGNVFDMSSTYNDEFSGTFLDDRTLEKVNAHRGAVDNVSVSDATKKFYQIWYDEYCNGNTVL